MNNKDIVKVDQQLPVQGITGLVTASENEAVQEFTKTGEGSNMFLMLKKTPKNRHPAIYQEAFTSMAVAAASGELTHYHLKRYLGTIIRMDGSTNGHGLQDYGHTRTALESMINEGGETEEAAEKIIEAIPQHMKFDQFCLDLFDIEFCSAKTMGAYIKIAAHRFLKEKRSKFKDYWTWQEHEDKLREIIAQAFERSFEEPGFAEDLYVALKTPSKYIKRKTEYPFTALKRLAVKDEGALGLLDIWRYVK